jgi:hypothetical protein
MKNIFVGPGVFTEVIKVISPGIQCHAVRLKPTDVSEQHFATSSGSKNKPGKKAAISI